MATNLQWHTCGQLRLEWLTVILNIRNISRPLPFSLRGELVLTYTLSGPCWKMYGLASNRVVNQSVKLYVELHSLFVFEMAISDPLSVQWF